MFIFSVIGQIPKSDISKSYIYVKILQITVKKNYINLHFKQYIRMLVSPYPYHY